MQPTSRHGRSCEPRSRAASASPPPITNVRKNHCGRPATRPRGEASAPLIPRMRTADQSQAGNSNAASEWQRASSARRKSFREAEGRQGAAATDRRSRGWADQSGALVSCVGLQMAGKGPGGAEWNCLKLARLFCRHAVNDASIRRCKLANFDWNQPATKRSISLSPLFDA